MKGWITAGIIILLLIVIGFLQTEGYLNFKWQWLTIIFAALAAPFKFFTGKFTKPSDELAEIEKQHELLRNKEAIYKMNLDNEVNARINNIKILQKDIDVIDAKLETLEIRKAALGVDVKNMTSEQKKKKFLELFGN